MISHVVSPALHRLLHHAAQLIPGCTRAVRLSPFPCLLAASSLAISTATAITYPPTSAFLYGNSSVDQIGKTSLVSGTGLPYRYLVPKNYNPSIQYPVVVFLHGQGQKGTNNTSQLDSNANGAMALVSTASPDNQSNYPCFFVAPQCSDGWSNKTAQIEAILNTLKRYYSIDQDRICLTGLSMGALSSWSIVAGMPNTFSCLVPQSGGGGGEVATMPRIPIWAFHAENDGTVVCNSTDQSVNTFRGRGFPVIYTRYSAGGHGIWSTAYQHPQLAKWIAAQRRGQPMQGAPDVAISTTSLATSPMKITGTTTSSSGIAVTRVGWCRSHTGGLTTGSDGLTDGSTTFRSATANFTATSLAGYRIGIRKKAGSTTSMFLYDVASVTNATTLILDRTSSSDTTARSYTLYRPGGYSILNPSPGTTSNSWATWTMDLPLVSGTQTVNIVAEFGSGSSSFAGRTTYNLPLSVTYAVPSGDTQPPSLSITTPATTAYITSASTATLSGTAADNVGVVSVSYTSDRGASGTATGTNAWSASNVPLSPGLNIFTLSAKDAKNNTSTVNTSVVFNPPANNDTTPPTVAIVTPTSNPTFDSPNARITLGGSASDDSSVSSVAWVNTANASSGIATGTTSWSVSGLTLVAGSNPITITATDSAGLTSTDSITVTYTPISATPTVNAGLDQTIILPGSATLSGTASDDGLPLGSELTATWSQVSGPGTVTFAEPNAATTTAHFPVAGAYVLQLAVDDSQTIGTDRVTVTVNPAPIISKRVRFDFGVSVATTTAVGWNNLTNFSSGVLANAKDIDGGPTTIGLSVTQPFDSSYDNGSTPAGLYTQPAMRDCFVTQMAPAKLRLSGLNPASSYTITLYAYRNTTDTDHVSRYTIGTTSQTLNAAKNTAGSSIFTGMIPDATGAIEITVDKNTGSNYGYLGVLEVQN